MSPRAWLPSLTRLLLAGALLLLRFFVSYHVNGSGRSLKTLENRHFLPWGCDWRGRWRTPW